MEFTVRNNKRKHINEPNISDDPVNNNTTGNFKGLENEEKSDAQKKHQKQVQKNKKKRIKMKAIKNNNKNLPVNEEKTQEIKKDASQNTKNKKMKHIRDFSKDLTEYIHLWNNVNNGSGWKFNKILQNWAVTNILSPEKINKVLFKSVCPYIATIQGMLHTKMMKKNFLF